MGQLEKFSVKGYINKSGEGQLNIGREGAPHEVVTTNSDGDQKVNSLNPWSFSAENPHWSSLLGPMGQYVAIKYHQSRIWPAKHLCDRLWLFYQILHT